MLVEPVGAESVAGSLGSNQGGHQQADPSTVHVVEAFEVEYDGLGSLSGFFMGTADLLFGERGDLTLDVDDAHAVGHLPDGHSEVGCGHLLYS